MKRKIKKIYKIWCEWDMGFFDAYSTEEKAQEDIDNTNWEELTGYTKEEAIDLGFVSIYEEEVI